MGFGAYTSEKMVQFYRRYAKLQNAYRNPQKLLSQSGKMNVDYIVVPTPRYRKTYQKVKLPVVFQNRRHTVLKADHLPNDNE